jgi:hypothetical protein
MTDYTETFNYVLPDKPVTKERVANDYYPTPHEITMILLDKIGAEIDYFDTVIDPCSGHGAILRAFEHDDAPSCYEISNEPYPPKGMEDEPLYYLDATQEESWIKLSESHNLDWVITNPPYDKDLMLPIMQHSLKHARKGFAALVRLSWLEPCNGRAEFLQANADQLRYVISVSPRPKFRADTKGSDNVTSCWMVWDKSWSWFKVGVDCPFVFASGWKK